MDSQLASHLPEIAFNERETRFVESGIGEKIQEAAQNSMLQLLRNYENVPTKQWEILDKFLGHRVMKPMGLMNQNVILWAGITVNKSNIIFNGALVSHSYIPTN